MASVKSALRTIVKPLFYKIMGERGYFRMQCYAKERDIHMKLVEEKEMELLPHFVKAGDTVLDIGANYAYYSVRLSDLVGKEGKVYAFEPIPFTHKVCTNVLKRFKADNVKLFNKGVSSETKTVTFSVPLQDFGAISGGQAHIQGRNNEQADKKTYYDFEKHAEFDCEVVDLDTLLGGDLTALSFVKIDIEGAELLALRGMRQILERFKPSMIVEIQPFFLKGYGIEVQEIETFMHDLGYRFYLYDEKAKKLKLHKGEYVDANYVLLHREQENRFADLLDLEA